MFGQNMFGDSLLETSWAQRSRRSWTTFTSFVLETMAIGLLLLLPLWKTVGLPAARPLSTPVSWGAPPPAAVHLQHTHITTVVQSNLRENVLIAPKEVPTQVAMIEETTAPPQVSFNTPGAEGGTGRGGEVWKAIGEPAAHPVPTPAPPPVAKVPQFRTSTILEGNLIRRVQPVYPPIARTARIQGPVILVAVISKAGTIENLRALSGHPMLVPAAVDAVSQWRYRPYILNNEPIEVETQITVNFLLSGN
ncbi:MAG TPA: energy transducer TonB [Candidatus Sulfotelmatobacter sp.]|nr:energy transducer TonB [Candidatus Sulfotelmatobacter sp.]